MDSPYIPPLADELELDLVSSFEGLGRFALSAPPSPALPSSVPSSVEGTPVQATRELDISDSPLLFDKYVLAGAPPGAEIQRRAGGSSPRYVWTCDEKENVQKEKHAVGSSKDKTKPPLPPCLLFLHEARFRPRATSTTSRSSKDKPASLPREALGTRPGLTNHSPHPSSPLSPRFHNR